MVDLFVDFGSNAPAVTREVDVLAKAYAVAEAQTKRLAAAASAHATATRAEVSAMRDASNLARRVASGGGLGQPSISPFSGQNGNGAQARTNALRALAAMNRDVRVQMEKNGEEAGGGFGSGLRRSLERAMNRGGFFGAKDSIVGNLFGGGQGGAGVAATIGISAGLTAITEGWKAATAAIDYYNARAVAAVQATQQVRDAQHNAQDSRNAAGLAAGQQFGDNLTRLNYQGKNGLSKKYAGEFGLLDSQNATLETSRFGENSEKALDIAARAARVGGGTLREALHNLGQDELANPDAAAARLAHYHNNRPGSASVTQFKLAEAYGNVDQDETAYRRNRAALARSDMAGMANISGGVAAAGDDYNRTFNGADVSISAAFNARQKAIEQAKAMTHYFNDFANNIIRTLSFGQVDDRIDAQTGTLMTDPIGASQ